MAIEAPSAELSNGENTAPLITLHNDITLHKNRIEQLETQVDTLRNTLDNKKLQSKQLKVKLATGGDITQLQCQLDDIHALITETHVKGNSLKQKIQLEDTLIVDYKEKYSRFESERLMLESSVDTSKLQEQLVAHYNSVQQQYTSEYHDVEKQYMILQSTYEQFTTQLFNYRQEYDTKTGQHQSLDSQLNASTVHLSELKDITENSTSMMNTLNSQITEKQHQIHHLDSEISGLNHTISTLQNQVHSLGLHLKEEIHRRKEFQFKYEDAKGKVRVYARVRPFNSNELRVRESTLLRCGMNEWTLEFNETQQDVMGNVSDKWRDYVFDHVFQYGLPSYDGTLKTRSNATQVEVFEECKDFGELTLNGINTCIFAYGQSGTGKTFTMAGIKPPVENPKDTSLLGLKPRMIEYIWQLVRTNSSTHTYSISAYMVEIYLNKLEDVFWKHENMMKKQAQAAAGLKSPKKSDADIPPELKVRVDEKKRVTIENVYIKAFDDHISMNEYVDNAELLRRTRKTGLNEASSRSHLVFTILVTATETKTGKTVRGKCSLVDLAGSERADKTNVDGLSKKERDSMLEEGIAINESLRMLKNVFRILGTQNAAPPAGGKKDEKTGKTLKGHEEVVQYRGNMLTELMQDSLGGNAKTLMFVNVGPAASNTSETQDSLQYGDFVKNITNEKASSDIDYTEQIRVLKQKIAAYEEKYEGNVAG